MKKIILSLVVMTISLASFAVPARRGFHDFQQADGSTISLTLAGDEFCHWYESADGTVYKQNADGMFVRSEKTRTDMFNRRKASPMYKSTQARRARQDVGTTPNLAPKGVVILANFSNKSMQSGHTQAVFDELCNSLNCTVNDGYPSAGQYFADQSNGAYRPIFDVFGPVTLSRNVAYYGTDKPGKDEGDDQHATDAVVEACRIANEQYTINWADYDSDNDGYVDFVYVIYAGKGQADGGTAETIWPHNWSVQEARSSGYCTYTANECKVGGKNLDNYAMSSELSGNALGGIGTLCHEFGHVMGLPDLYDIEYGTIYENSKTPNDWNIMDGGSYNADGHCPPNYDPWEKDFFGWLTPINLGSEGQNVTLYANGTENFQTYQINASGSYVGPTTSGLRYYIENRQAQGWDEPLTGHGMLIWKVNFNETAWINNAPNGSETSGAPLYTIVSATGTKIGWDGNTDNCPKNTFPGSGNKTSWSGVNGKPLLNIAESNGVITLTYIEEPAVVIDPFELTWMVGGTEFVTTMSTNTGKVVLPENDPTPCDDNKVFVGWTRTANYTNATTAPTFVKAGDAAEEGDIFYAVFATATESGPAAVSDVLTLATTGVSGTNYAEWSGKTLTSTAVYAGQSAGDNNSIQLRSKNSNSGIITTASGGKVSKVTVVWNNNTTSGRTLDIYGKNTAYSSATDLYGNNQGTKLGSIVCGTSTELTVSGDYAFIGMRSNSGAMYLTSVTVTWGSGSGVAYSDYTTACTTTETSVVNVPEYPAAVKAIRNGQVVIIRDGQVFNLLGVQQ